MQERASGRSDEIEKHRILCQVHGVRNFGEKRKRSPAQKLSEPTWKQKQNVLFEMRCRYSNYLCITSVSVIGGYNTPQHENGP